MAKAVGMNKIMNIKQWWPEDDWPEVRRLLDPGAKYFFDSYFGTIELEPGDFIATVYGGHKIVFRLNKGIQRAHE